MTTRTYTTPRDTTNQSRDHRVSIHSNAPEVRNFAASTSGIHLGRNMLQLFGSRGWPSIDVAKVRCQAFAESLGFPCFLVTLRFLRPPSQVVRASISSFPRTWIAHYRRRNYFLTNPIIEHMRDSVAPFCWDETNRQSRQAQRYHRDATEHGVGEGFTVPLRCPGGEIVSLSLAGTPVPHAADDRWKLYSACYRFLCSAVTPLRTLLLHDQPHQPLQSLTPRQREILLLMMRGRTVKQIARELGLHVRAVEDRLARACTRLKANSREQAMVRALTSRQIEMLSDGVQSLASVETHLHDTVNNPVKPSKRK